MANLLGCKVSSLPLKYLSLPVGSASRGVAIWDSVIEKIEHRLAGWRKLYLSKVGKTTLIKSTLSNLLTYFLVLFLIPTFVANCIGKLFRDFLSCGLGDKSKFHPVK